jgi:hypothetical protein
MAFLPFGSPLGQVEPPPGSREASPVGDRVRFAGVGGQRLVGNI